MSMIRVAAKTNADHVGIVTWLGRTHGLVDSGTSRLDGDGLVGVWLYTFDKDRAKAAVKALNRLKGTSAHVLPIDPAEYERHGWSTTMIVQRDGRVD